MSRKLTLPLAFLLSLLPATALAGPTWLSIELPPSPWGQKAKLDPVLYLRAPHLAEHEGRISATAEGRVGSKRKSMALTLHPTGIADVWAVQHEWPRRGQWVLVFRATGHIPSTAVVDLRKARLGTVGFSEFEERTHDARTYENVGVMSKVGTVSDAEIDAMLAGTGARSDRAAGSAWRPLALGLGASILVLFAMGTYGPLRRCRSRSDARRAMPVHAGG